MLSRQAGKGPDQARLVLDRRETPDRADDVGVARHSQFVAYAHVIAGSKSLRVDSVRDLHDLFGGDSDAIGQPGIQVVGDDHESVDQVTTHASNAILETAAPFGIIA